MPYDLKSLTPNLIVSDVAPQRRVLSRRPRLLAGPTVPEADPSSSRSCSPGRSQIFLNAPEPAIAEYPAFKDRPIGGTLTLFIDVEHRPSRHETLKEQVKIVMPLEKKWYGVTEFAFEDPDGYLITFAERDEQQPEPFTGDQESRSTGVGTGSRNPSVLLTS